MYNTCCALLCTTVLCRYGDGPEGFLAFLKEQLAAFEGCVARHGSLEECVLLFESLDTANEKVFFHCDQVSAN